MAERHREEVLNTFLAVSLGRRGVDADPETILRKGRPDVIAKFRGLRCAIEGKIADTPRATTVVLRDAQSRIDQGIAHVAIAVVYPALLRSTDIKHLRRELGSARFEFCVLTDAGGEGWRHGGLNDIVAELRRAHEVIVRDDVLQQAVDTLNIGLAEVSSALLGSKGTCDRLIKVLGVGNKSDATASV
jgi:hypothetical protein